MTRIVQSPGNVNLIMMIVQSPGNCLHLFDLGLDSVVGSSKPLNHLATFFHAALPDQDVILGHNVIIVISMLRHFLHQVEPDEPERGLWQDARHQQEQGRGEQRDLQ